MKPLASFLVISSLAGSISFAHADAGQDLLAKSNCLACHAVSQKIIGPSYKEVAAKYANDPKAEAKLAKKIKNGGGGVWGEDKMPAQPKLSKADALTLSKYILSLKAE